MGFDLGGGVLGDAFGAITNTIDAGTGGWWSDQSTKASAKRQYKYNYNLMKENQAFQQYMAENAHQMEMADLQAAGLNPALTVTGSSAGSIAGGSSSQSTGGGQAVDTLKNIADSINAIRTTNANIDKTKAEIDNIKQDTEIKKKGLAGATFGTQAVDAFVNRVQTEKNSAKKMVNKSIKEHWNDFKKHLKENTPFGMLMD